ncbi:repressor LexA [Alkalithermobacter thermoalcaliphilus JW-YL-7 = DSM 7308]|uniref:LexA repressor n=1 Tax=Alkalithermobacter thermoalcaliphilus JW-YL-7 = DSM 7308 TaxID=1121328 RepID=A0A150FQD5_CLOPD|nr:SOS-response transcriptional repressor, LexA [[Clostridium] paradoxum JW-YL-7 = DSM 7308]SHK80685.1 repressor LexA [[Clostridium] paradoxum JW-YL-7 = DSM 7308]
MFDDLNKKQIEILNFIKSELTRVGYPPSVREICSAVGLKSTSTVHSHLNKLEEKGYIRKDPTKPRAIEVLDFDSNRININESISNIPIVGQVTAGSPILALENVEDFFPLPNSLLKGHHSFMLKVKGDSMINAGIFDGDYILVKQQNTAKDGDIVVALINDNEATVKRFYKEKNIIRLQPENDFMDPIYVDDIKILGIVYGLFRFNI